MSFRPGGAERRSASPRIRAAAVVALAAASVRCATSTGGRTPLPEPGEVAARAAAAAPDRPYRVVFGWEYADERGPVRGEGVLRYTPPDSLRLDLFSAADASMSVALVSGELRTAGQIQDVRLPPPAFLYATAGLFRPGRGEPAEGWTTDGERILTYRTSGSGTLVYRLRGPRIVRLEERASGRELRRLELTWGDAPGAWPGRAEYRDETEASRARWTVEEARVEEEPFPDRIYDLSDTP